jgi:hypothetical protein
LNEKNQERKKWGIEAERVINKLKRGKNKSKKVRERIILVYRRRETLFFTKIEQYFIIN